MGIKVKYTKGIFEPINVLKGIEEGVVLEVCIETEDFHSLAMAGESFGFLKEDPELYSEQDLIERY